jgi:ADP-ribosyl-[dinitrogen reductase] hydrolase
VVLFFADDPAKAITLAAEQARITHQSPGILDCCRYLAALMLAALEGRPKSEWRVRARSLFKTHYGKAAKPEVARLVEAKRLPNEPGDDDPRDCVAALRMVLWAINHSADFATGLVLVVNRGGHSDVHGALFGQLAGAHYGIDAVPKAWRSRLTGLDRIEGIAGRLSSRNPL